MKNKVKTLVSLFLAAVLCFSACGESDKTPIDNNDADSAFVYTDIELCNADYKIILPNTPSAQEEHAAQELKTYYKQATGYELKTENDNGVSYDENASYFSVGRTDLLATSGIEVSYNELGRDGYKIVRKNRNLYMCGGGDYGTLYSVYEFLHQNFGFEPYAPDEIYIGKFESVKLIDFNFTDKPAFDDRCGGYWVATSDDEFAAKWRVYASYQNKHNGTVWGSWGHSCYMFCNPVTYYADHRDWYSDKIGNNGYPCQLCYTNTEMREVFLQNLKERILFRDDVEYFMIGLNDYIDCYCTCETCTARAEEIKYSGIIIEFVNYLAKEVSSWLKEIGDERNVKLIILGYYEWELPPVKLNDGGEYVPVCDSVICEPNVGVMIAPIYSDFGKEYLDEEHNARSREAFLGWSAICDNLMVWSYSTNFNLCFEWFDNFDVIQKNYQMFRDLGLTLVFDEAGAEWNQSNAFQIMIGYVNSKLFWNPDLNAEQLRDDFMRHYYKDAYPMIKEYYQQMRLYFKNTKLKIEQKTGESVITAIMTNRGEKSLTKDFWSFSFLKQMEGLFNDAYEAIDLSDLSKLEKQKVKNRVVTESLTIRYLQLELFANEYGENDYYKMIEDFKKDTETLNMSLIQLTKTNEQVFERWKASKI